MKTVSTLRSIFILGAVVDGVISVSWFLIASGWDIPNILNGYIGTGQDYRLAMYVAAIFMASWSALLAWGSFKPIQRRAILLIASVFLLLSAIIELMFFRDILGGAIFTFGASKRFFLVALFTAAYFISLKHNPFHE
jgi:hypothetical protein